MTIPDDLGAPLTSAPQAVESHGKSLSVNTPIAVIASNPQGRAVLDQDLPGLCERPEYSMFKSMSLARLAGLSRGRITRAKLNVIESDLGQASLAAVQPAQSDGEPPRR